MGKRSKKLSAAFQEVCSRASDDCDWRGYDGRLHCTLKTCGKLRVAPRAAGVDARVAPVQPVIDMTASTARRAEVFASVMRPVTYQRRVTVVFVTIDDMRIPTHPLLHMAAAVWTGRAVVWYDPMGPWRSLFYGSDRFMRDLTGALGMPLVVASHGEGIQAYVRRDACLPLACYGAMEIARAAPLVQPILESLHDPHDIRERHADRALTLSRALLR